MIKLSSKKLDKKVDERGFLTELINGNDIENKKFGQLIITTAKPGFTKGKHYHKRKREWYLVIGGEGDLLVRNRKTGEVKRKKMNGEKMELVEIPVGYYHEIKNAGSDILTLLTYTDEIFNPNDPDTYYD